MKAEVGPFLPVYLDRIVQLTNKTNQFNLTTKRYTLAAMTEAAADPDQLVLYGRLVDNFGDNGVVSVLLGRCEDVTLHLDLWLMSCRVLKRGMEAAMLDQLVSRALARGLEHIIGYYRPSAKNSMVALLFQDFGFHRISDDAERGQAWQLTIGDDYRPKNTLIEINP
jgi:FkbH-like protein